MVGADHLGFATLDCRRSVGLGSIFGLVLPGRRFCGFRGVWRVPEAVRSEPGHSCAGSEGWPAGSGSDARFGWSQPLVSSGVGSRWLDKAAAAPRRASARLGRARRIRGVAKGYPTWQKASLIGHLASDAVAAGAERAPSWVIVPTLALAPHVARSLTIDVISRPATRDAALGVAILHNRLNCSTKSVVIRAGRVGALSLRGLDTSFEPIDALSQTHDLGLHF